MKLNNYVIISFTGSGEVFDIEKDYAGRIITAETIEETFQLWLESNPDVNYFRSGRKNKSRAIQLSGWNNALGHVVHRNNIITKTSDALRYSPEGIVRQITNNRELSV